MPVNYISSFHSIMETLRASPKGCTLYVAGAGHHAGPRIRQILEEAEKKGIAIRQLPEMDLSRMCPEHRGLVLEVPIEARGMFSMETLCEHSASKDEGLVFVLDHIEDPHNLGAIIRSADAFGVDAVVIPTRRASPLTDAAERSAAGATAWLPVIQAKNLRAAVDQLKDAGFWIYAADMTGRALSAKPLEKKAAILLGNEGKGVSKILRDAADECISIPMFGHVESLNVSVSAAIFMYEYRRAH
jgi:23S rRNA (guanosine2251-2'-O)-methyltransferase